MTLPKRIIALTAMAAVTITASIVSGHKGPGNQSDPHPKGSQPSSECGKPRFDRVTVKRVNCCRCLCFKVTVYSRFTRVERLPSTGLALDRLRRCAVRATGCGVAHTAGRSTGTAFMFTRHDASGAFVGSSKVTSALVLDASGDAWTSNSQVEVFDAAGNLILAPCVTATGTRFE